MPSSDPVSPHLERILEIGADKGLQRQALDRADQHNGEIERARAALKAIGPYHNRARRVLEQRAEAERIRLEQERQRLAVAREVISRHRSLIVKTHQQSVTPAELFKRHPDLHALHRDREYAQFRVEQDQAAVARWEQEHPLRTRANMPGREGTVLQNNATAAETKLAEIDAKIRAMEQDPKLRQQLERSARDRNAEIELAKKELTALAPKVEQAQQVLDEHHGRTQQQHRLEHRLELDFDGFRL